MALNGKISKGLAKKRGLSPGTLVYVGRKKREPQTITACVYSEEALEEKQVANLDGEIVRLAENSNVWLNVDGLHDITNIQKIGDLFGIHPLVLEDIVNTKHRPKLDAHTEYLFFVLKMFYFDEKRKQIKFEQVSFLLGRNYVISFQEARGDVFAPVRARLQNAQGRIRRSAPDYLFYALIDAVVDHYFVVIEKIEDYVAEVDDELLESPDSATLNRIHSLKKDVQYLRRMVLPLRESVYALMRSESELVREESSLFFRDLYDHILHALDALDSARDTLSGMGEFYMSVVNNRVSEVMRILTIMASVFIPLTFIVGVYGMNFEFMPELRWRYGYQTIWGVMVVVVIGILIFFRRRKWI